MCGKNRAEQAFNHLIISTHARHRGIPDDEIRLTLKKDAALVLFDLLFDLGRSELREDP